jgi:hypothetical protein
MKHLKTLAVLLICISHSAVSDDILDRTHAINQKSLELLGVDLMALSYLMKANLNSYLPLETYKKRGEYKYFEQLEENGYIRIEIVDDLPDGSGQGQQIRLLPLMKGLEVQTAIKYP